MKLKKSSLVIPLSFAAFISLGLPDGLMGVAWPGIASSFTLPLDYVGILLITGTAGYIISSFFSPSITRILGVGGLLAASCFLTATGLLVYGSTPTWMLFIPFSIILGVGAGAIDAGINTYIAQNHSERLMHWLHASFGIGITAGPVIMTLGIRYSGTWRTGYYITGIAQLILATIFLLNRSQWSLKTDSSEIKVENEQHSDAPMSETLKLLPAYLSMLLFLLYTGVELGFGLWIFTILTKSRGVDPQIAGFLTSAYWGTFTVGRVLAGFSSNLFNGTHLLFWAMISAIFGLSLVIIDLNIIVTIMGITLLGLALAPVFPGLVSDTENRVGRRHQANTIGMQISAAGLGAAALPALAGTLGESYSLEIIPAILLTSLVVLFICFILSHLFKKSL
ncbi:MAG: MFS transporter [Spirochaetes bacterium]|jgi:fucose permease|nr:MFS transporter [Spirochaetota bacterium]